MGKRESRLTLTLPSWVSLEIIGQPMLVTTHLSSFNPKVERQTQGLGSTLLLLFCLPLNGFGCRLSVCLEKSLKKEKVNLDY